MTEGLITPARHLLVVATQCEKMEHLDQLPAAAERLRATLLDPAIGGCTPGLPDGSALVGGADRVDADRVRREVRAASEYAGQRGATLVLALLGHGFIPGNAPTLYLMAADSTDQVGWTAVQVPELLVNVTTQVGTPGVVAIVDTCASAAAIPSPGALTTGVTDGYAGLALLMAASVGREAYDFRLSRELSGLLAEGVPEAGPRLRVNDVGGILNQRIDGQLVSHNEYGAGGGLWLAFNRHRRPPPDPMPDESYRGAVRAYLKWAVRQWSYIELGNLGMEQDPPEPTAPGGPASTATGGTASNAGRLRLLQLRKMYISLEADPRTIADRRRATELNQADRRDLGDKAAASMRSGGDIARRMVAERGGRPAPPDPGQSPAGPESISLDQAFDDHQLLVVLGEPGSGKSVLCLWLGLTLAGQALTTLLESPGTRLRIPLRFRAADYAAFYADQLAAGEAPGSIERFLAETLEKPVSESGEQIPARQLEAMFARALRDGEAVLLIDGLDELIDYREEILHALGTAAERYLAGPGAEAGQVVITSRVAGYDEAYLTTERAAHYLIRPMSPTQASLFITNFFAQIDRADHAPRFLAQLEESDPATRRLATTPLLLTSMCSYWHRHGELPAHRSVLYRRLILDLAYRWRDFPGATNQPELQQLLGQEEQFLAMLAAIATRIHEEHANGLISEDELLDVLDEALFGAARLTEVDPRPIGRALVDRIRQRDGTLSERAPRRFGFHHPTFREYLTGLQLLLDSGQRLDQPASLGAIDTLFHLLQERIDDPRWREPILLALGECSPVARTALTEAVVEQGNRLLPEAWTSILLAAAMEQPVATAETELPVLLRHAASAYQDLRDYPEVRDELDDQLAALRQQLGADGFDRRARAMIIADAAVTAPLAALYWRRRWLSIPVLASLASVAHRDSGDWDWPIQRALRLAAAPAPIREATVLPALEPPPEPDPSGDADALERARAAARLFRLGRAAWQRQRRLVDESQVAGLPSDLFPIRQIALRQPARWAACLQDEACARVLVTLFGGLTHHDTLHWAGEYLDFARLLQQGDQTRQAEVEERAAELVPRFGADDTIYQIAVMLDTVGAMVTYSTPASALDPRWLTLPSTPLVASAFRRWLGSSRRKHRDRLRATLEQLARSPDRTVPAVERVQAELGLLVLDGTSMTSGPESARALAAALAATGDAVVRSHQSLFRAIWSPAAPLTLADRASAHQLLLHLIFSITGGPVPLDPSPEHLGADVGMHPVLRADALARRLLARSWGRDVPADLGLAGETPEQALSTVAWLAYLPYHDHRLRPVPPDLDDLTDGDARDDRDSAGLLAAVRSLTGWVHRVAPHFEAELHTAIADAGTDLASDPETPPPAATRRSALAAPSRADALLPRLPLPRPPDVAAASLIERIGPLLPAADRIGLLVVARLLTEQNRQTGSRTSAPEASAMTPGISMPAGAGGSQPRSAEAWGLPLDRRLLERIVTLCEGDPEHREQAAQLLERVSRIDPEAVAPLQAMIDADPDSGWAATGRHLLLAHRVRSADPAAETFAGLVDAVLTGPAAIAARAHRELIGPYRSVERPDRRYRLSANGADLWWDLGRQAWEHRDTPRGRIFTEILYEWDLDDAAAVTALAGRYRDGDATTRAVWLRLLGTAGVIRPEVQQSLATWVSTLPPDRPAASACLFQVGLQTTGAREVVPEFAAAAAGFACRSGAADLALPPDSGSVMITAARAVAEACAEALPGEAPGAAAVEKARAGFRDRLVPVVECGKAPAIVDPEHFGKMFTVPSSAAPENVAGVVPEDLPTEPTIALLRGWLHELADSGAHRTGSAPEDYLALEAVLNLLVVLSTRDRKAFLLRCPPEPVQPVLTSIILSSGWLAGVAALTLLGRLQFVDFSPATGADLVTVLDAALRGLPQLQAAARRFAATIRYVRGASLASVLVEQIQTTRNETVVRAFASLAVAHLESTACTTADRRRIRAVLHGDPGQPATIGDRRPVYLVGNGSQNDPVGLAVGPDRRTEFRRLLYRGREPLAPPDPDLGTAVLAARPMSDVLAAQTENPG